MGLDIFTEKGAPTTRRKPAAARPRSPLKQARRDVDCLLALKSKQLGSMPIEEYLSHFPPATRKWIRAVWELPDPKKVR